MSYRIKMARAATLQLQESLPEAVAAACLEFILGPLAEEPRRVEAPLRLSPAAPARRRGTTSSIT